MGLEITSIPQGVLAVELDGHGFSSLLEKLLEQPSEDLTALGAVRYLFHKKLWDSTQPLAPEVLNKFYGPQTFTPEALTPEQYRAGTAAVILSDYAFEMPEYVPYVAPPREDRPQRDFSKPGKKPKRQAVERHDGNTVTDLTEGESGSRTYRSLADHGVDTTGASERVKKVIGIQRG